MKSALTPSAVFEVLPALEALNIPTETRPDKLSVDQYAQLTRLLFDQP